MGSRARAKRLQAEGYEIEKEWIATRDGRTRDTHRAADGQRQGLDEAYSVGGYAAMHPLDAGLPASESVACRCAESYELADAGDAGFMT